MDPLGFHREALSVAQGVVDEVDRSQFELPTPCDEWNVRQILVSTDLAPAMYTTALEPLQLRFATTGRNPHTDADETQPREGATAADRFAAFAGRRA